MTTFKRGDKFIPYKPKANKRIMWNDSMDIYDGQTLTVDYITAAGNIKPKEGSCLFSPDWCEKVGDSEFPNNHIPEVGKTIDWEQRRYELAKEFMSPLLIGLKTSEIAFIPIAVSTAIVAADELIKQLKEQ